MHKCGDVSGSVLFGTCSVLAQSQPKRNEVSERAMPIAHAVEPNATDLRWQAAIASG